jgi:hypothetical protein
MRLNFRKSQKALFGTEKEIYSPRGIRLGEIHRIFFPEKKRDKYEIDKDDLILSIPRKLFLSLSNEEFEQIKKEARGL